MFAKCALTARRGIAALLRKESPAATFKPASPSPEAVATPTVGETLFAALRVRGEKATQQLRDALVHGWAGWEQWHLSSKQVDDLFAGKCEEAEEVRAWQAVLVPTACGVSACHPPSAPPSAEQASSCM